MTTAWHALSREQTFLMYFWQGIQTIAISTFYALLFFCFCMQNESLQGVFTAE